MSRRLAVGCRSGKQSRATAAPIALMLVFLALSATLISARLSPATAAEQPASVETKVGVSADAEQSSGATAQVPSLAEQIQIETITDLSKVMVGQQIVLRVLVIGDGPLPPGRLILPHIDSADLLILSEDRRIDHSADTVPSDSDSTNDTENTGESSLNSRRWVYERRYALFPRSAGPLDIPPSVFSAWRPGADGPEELSSAGLRVEVMPAQPPPLETAPDSAWLPAQQLSLSEAGSSIVQLAPGQVIERMLTLKAVGLRAEDLPPIPTSIPFPLRVHEDEPRLWNEREPDGVTGYRTERITVSSAEPGLYQLPAISIDWWNVDDAHWERATTPDWQLQVAVFDSSSRRPAPDWRRDGSTDASTTEDTALPTGPAPKQPWVVAHWPWILVPLGLLIVIWQRRRLYQLIRRIRRETTC